MNDLEDSEYCIVEDTRNLIPIPQRTDRGSKCFCIEPVVFLIALAGGLFDTVLPNVIELRYCSAVLDRPVVECYLNSTSVSQDDIQKFTTTFQMIRTAVETVIPCILSFYLGPWSDKYGRRPLLISSTIGFFICYSFWTWASNIPTLKPIYFILFSVPYAFSGGASFLYLCSFCYVCDVTPVEKRSTRLGLVQASFLLGSLVGVQLCPVINNYGYSVTFAVASIFAFLSLMYSYFILPESIIPTAIDMNAESRNPFNSNHIRDLIDACYTKQSPVTRLQISISMMVLTISLIQISGETGIMYVFLQKILEISLSDYTFLISYSITIAAIAAYLIPRIFSQNFKVDDLYLLSITIFTRILAALSIVFGNRVWHIYLSRTLNCTLGLTGPLARSYLSRIIHEDQLGKVFSLMASAESSTPLFGALAYSIVYNWTLTTHPEAVFLLSGFLMIVQLLLVILLLELPRPKLLPKDVCSEAPSINA